MPGPQLSSSASPDNTIHQVPGRNVGDSSCVGIDTYPIATTLDPMNTITALDPSHRVTIGQTFTNGAGAYCPQFRYSEQLTILAPSRVAPHTVIVVDGSGRRAYMTGDVR